MAKRVQLTLPTNSTEPFATISATKGIYVGQNGTKISLNKLAGVIGTTPVRLVQTGRSKDGNAKYTAFSPETGEIVLAFYVNAAGLGQVDPSESDRRIVAAMLIEVDDDDLPNYA